MRIEITVVVVRLTPLSGFFNCAYKIYKHNKIDILRNECITPLSKNSRLGITENQCIIYSAHRRTLNAPDISSSLIDYWPALLKSWAVAPSNNHRQFSFRP